MLPTSTALPAHTVFRSPQLAVREAFTRKLRDIPAALRLSLTYDHGKEMAEHSLKVFFCHAHSPWERATCESRNDRIRHYLPKGTDLSKVSCRQLSAYQEMLNERLGMRVPEGACTTTDVVSKLVR